MTLKEFFIANNASELNLYNSTKSTRKIGNIIIGGNKELVMTTAVFDAKQPIHVYAGEVTNEDTGEIKSCFFLSNKVARAADLVLSLADLV